MITDLSVKDVAPVPPFATVTAPSAIIAVVTASFSIVKAPPEAIVALPLTSLKTASLMTLKSALFNAPAFEIKNSSVSATSPVISD